MPRKLVTVQTISSLEEIAGADKIVLARMQDNAWQVVVKKDDFKVGDKAIYFEIDSFLPADNPAFQFLGERGRKVMDGVTGYVLKTIKLKGVLSQGLLLPISHFDHEVEGNDLTEFFRVVVYEPPHSNVMVPNGKVQRNFPAFLPKTEQERIQNCPQFLSRYKEVRFEVTVKMDGSSMTAYLKDDVFGVCSRNLEIDRPDADSKNQFWDMAKKYNLEEHMRRVGKNMAVQGELVGDGIQKNRAAIKGRRFMVFDVFNIDEQRYLTPRERYEYCFAICAEHVPRIDDAKPLNDFASVDEILAFAEGEGFNNKEREGLVFKSTQQVEVSQGPHKPSIQTIISFKAISNRYLLNEK